MKLLLLLAAIVAAGIILTLIALSRQPTEIGTTITEKIPLPAPRETALPEPPSPTTPVIKPTIPTTPSAIPKSPTSACLALEQHLLEELDDAQQELNRKQNEYDSLVETYEDLLDVKEKDPQRLDQIRAEKEAAKQAYEDARGEYNGALKRLSKARIECGIFQ